MTSVAHIETTCKTIRMNSWAFTSTFIQFNYEKEKSITLKSIGKQDQKRRIRTGDKGDINGEEEEGEGVEGEDNFIDVLGSGDRRGDLLDPLEN